MLKKGVVSTPFSMGGSIAALLGNRKDDQGSRDRDRGDCDRATSEMSSADFGDSFGAIAAWGGDAIGAVQTSLEL